MAPCPLGAGQYHSFDLAVLLHRHIDAGLEARGQDANAHTYVDAHKDANSLAHFGAGNTDGDAVANAHSMVPSHGYPDRSADFYAHANRDRYAASHGNADAYDDACDAHGHSHADRHFHAYRYGHTDRNAHGNADRNTHAHGYSDGHGNDMDHADAHTDDIGNADAHTDDDHHANAGDVRRSLFRNKEFYVDPIHLLRTLSETNAIAGYEGEACELLRETWQPFVDDSYTGKLGSLIALKRGSGPEPRPKVMVAAHMDEVGLMVTGIEKGFLRIAPVGGADRRVLLGLDVTVHGQRDLPGIVATRPPHVLSREERTKVVAWDRLFVDVGLPAEEVERLVSVGDLVSVQREMAELKNRRVAGKAMDDRACVAAVTLALEQLKGVSHAWDVVAVATAQEETGLKGATAAAYGVAPDLAVALDVTFGKQPGISDTDDVFPLGQGPTIGVGPNFHPGLVKRLMEVADAHEIPYRIEPLPGRSGTDAWAIQVSREGVPTALISVPIRYMHQPVETLAVQDVERAGRLLAAFIGGMEADFLEKLTWDSKGESE